MYYEGKQRVLSGAEDGGAAVWQNIDGGGFITPIGPSGVDGVSLHAQRISGDGGYEIGVKNWTTGGVYSIGSGSTDGFASFVPTGFDSASPLYVKIPKGTTWRLSFLFAHRPD